MDERYSYANFLIARTKFLRVIDPKIQNFYVSKINNLIGLPDDNQKLPISNPASIMRSDLPSFRIKKYVISEKTDGVRYLLFLTKSWNGSNVLLMIDRSYGIYIIPGIIFSDDLYQGTLLDGELIEEEKIGFKIYIFDILVFCGNNITSHPHISRYKAIVEIFEEKKYIYNNHDTFELVPKKFYEMRELNHFIESVLPQLKHKNDGIIFTQVDSLYKFGMQRSILKWKSKQFHTVDFLVKIYTGDGAPDINRNYDLDNEWVLELWLFDHSGREILAQYTPILQSELEGIGLKDIRTMEDLVVECVWDSDRCWRPVRVRHDKSEPNSEYVFRRTIKNIEENIEVEDIKKNLDFLGQK